MNEESDDVGPVLGSLRMTSNASDTSGGGPQHAFSLTLTNEATSDLPQEYNLQLLTGARDQPGMLAFSNNGGRLASEGTVQHRFETELASRPGPSGKAPSVDLAYRKLSRERHQAASTKTRTIQYTDVQITNLRRPVGAEAERAKRKAETEKRVALEADQLHPLLFKLFERQAHWKFGQLQQQTEQPTAHLKIVLSEIAVQAKSGPYKDLWELKREFRTGKSNGE